MMNISITQPVRAGPVEQYNTHQLGTMIQSLNPHKIIAISWSVEGSGPTLFAFKDIDEIVNMLEDNYTYDHEGPFMLAAWDEAVFTKQNPVLQFNDDKLEIIVTIYKSEGYVYKFFRPEAFEVMKQQMVEKTIPWPGE